MSISPRSRIGRALKELGFSHLSPRPKPPKQDPEAIEALKNFSACVAATLAGKPLAAASPIEVWFQDEMRVGQKNGLVYQWAKTGTRLRQPKDGCGRVLAGDALSANDIRRKENEPPIPDGNDYHRPANWIGLGDPAPAASAAGAADASALPATPLRLFDY